MLIEDEAADSRLIQRAFQTAGVQNPIQVMSHGDMALAYLEGIGEYADRVKYPLPILILLDLKLPGMPGLQILKWIRIRRELRLIPVVVLTNSADSGDVKSSYEAGANSYLLKPADRNEVQRVIEVIRTYWLQHNITASLVLRANSA